VTSRPATSISIEPATTADGYAEGRALFREYAEALGVDLCFQGFARELDAMGTMYAAPHGCLLLIRLDGHSVGCVGMRPFRGELRDGADDAGNAGVATTAGMGTAGGVCEMKRLYVQPAARGSHLGRALAVAVIDRARAAGYRTMVLDTLGSMVVAQALYRSLGFREIAPYYQNPLGDVTFLGLELGEVASTPAGWE
jgi:putative acetyltransferase